MTSIEATPGWKVAFRALDSRNFRLFFYGQGLSLIGSNLTRTANLWVIWQLTGSPKMLGLSGFAGLIPMFLLAPLGGALVDRWDRRRVLLTTQVLMMMISVALTILSATGWINAYWIIGLMGLHGMTNAFDNPARHSFFIRMVDRREDLSSAIALHSSMIHLAHMIAPAVAGFLLWWVGNTWCFLLDAVSFLAVIASLLAMSVKSDQREVRDHNVWQDLAEGIRYVNNFVPMRAILLLVATVSLIAMSYQTLVPMFAHNKPWILGLLMSSAGLGALVAAYMLALRRTVIGLGKVIAGAAALQGAALIGFALSHWLPWSALAMAVTGFGTITMVAASQTVLQTLVEDDKRARVMSLFTMAFLGFGPFGSLLGGKLADMPSVGPAKTVILGGLLCIVAAGAFALYLPRFQRKVRDILRQPVLVDSSAPVDAG